MTRNPELPPEAIQRIASTRAGIAAIVVGLLIAIGSGSLRLGDKPRRVAVEAEPTEVIVVVPAGVGDVPADDGEAGANDPPRPAP